MKNVEKLKKSLKFGYHSVAKPGFFIRHLELSRGIHRSVWVCGLAITGEKGFLLAPQLRQFWHILTIPVYSSALLPRFWLFWWATAVEFVRRGTSHPLIVDQDLICPKHSSAKPKSARLIWLSMAILLPSIACYQWASQLQARDVSHTAVVPTVSKRLEMGEGVKKRIQNDSDLFEKCYSPHWRVGFLFLVLYPVVIR